MLEGKKIATRESYGNALVELGKVNDKVVVLTQTWQGQPKQAHLKRHIRIVSLIVVLPKETWPGLQPAWLPRVWFHL